MCDIETCCLYTTSTQSRLILKNNLPYWNITTVSQKKNHIQINQYYKKSQPNAVYCTGGNFCFERKCLVGIYWGNINNDDNNEQ